MGRLLVLLSPPPLVSSPLSVYVPFLAAARGWQVVIVLAVFYSMLCLWCLLGHSLVQVGGGLTD